jgi:hypothetical protein
VFSDGTNYLGFDPLGNRIGTENSTPGPTINSVFSAIGKGRVHLVGNGDNWQMGAGATQPIAIPSGCLLTSDYCAPSTIDGTALTGGVTLLGPAGAINGGSLVTALDTVAAAMFRVGVNVNGQANRCVTTAGNKNRFWENGFVGSTGDHVRLTDVASNTHDAYTDQEVFNNYINGNGSATAQGIVGTTSGGGGSSRSTDAHIFNNRVFGCLAAAYNYTLGGWRVLMNHFNGTTAATAMFLTSGSDTVLGNTFDSCGGGPYLTIAGTGGDYSHNKFLLAGGNTGGPFPIISRSSGSSFAIIGNTLIGGGGQTYTYFYANTANPSGLGITVAFNRARVTLSTTGFSDYMESMDGYDFIGNYERAA